MHPDSPGPTNTRSSLVLETIAEMVRPRSFGSPVVKIEMGRSGQNGWSHIVFGGDAIEVIPLVARGEVDIAILNPSAILTAAYRGTGPFSEPYPLRAVTVIPSLDWMGF